MTWSFWFAALLFLGEMGIQGFRLGVERSGRTLFKMGGGHAVPPLSPTGLASPSQATQTPSTHPITHRLVTLMLDIWGAVSFPNPSSEVRFPLEDYGLSRQDVKGLIHHFQTCKDCAADNAFLMATQDSQGRDCLQLNYVEFPLFSDDAEDEEWGNIDRSLLGQEQEPEQEDVFPTESRDDVVIRDSKEWVRAVIANFGVCPFTLDPDRGGIPMGGIRYSLSRATTVEEAFYRFWEEIHLLHMQEERAVSTVLLIFPELSLFGNYELFEAYTECLSDALSCSSLGVEADTQLVFFHPRYQFRDGQARSAEDEESSATNYARRAPWPMINILRTPQVVAAQRGVPTGVVYQQNEERLRSVGTQALHSMLQQRNWSSLPCASHKITKKVEQQQESEKGLVDLKHPLLTSTSTDKAPWSVKSRHCLAMQTVPEDSLSNGRSPHQQVSKLEEMVCPMHVDGREAHEVDAGGNVDVVEDYLKLADQVDEWLSQGEI
eukprot:gene10798-12000_t